MTGQEKDDLLIQVTT